MNMYVVLIGAMLLILMVAFGRNPVEEARQKRAQRGGDALVNAIADYNKKTHGPAAFGLPAPGGNGFTSVGRSPAPSTYPPYMMTNPQPFQPNPAPQNNSYYPPAPAGTAPSPLQQPQGQQAPSSQPPS
jgi:hypothetical protein